jgi:hypothetical protein
VSGYAVKRLEDVPSVPDTEPADPDWKPIQHHFRLGAFGMNAYVASEPGGILIHPHDERRGGHEEVYVVLRGEAEFIVGDDRFDAPAVTLVAVRDVGLSRSAVAGQAGTTVLVVGGKPGEQFTGSTWRPEWFEQVPQI